MAEHGFLKWWRRGMRNKLWLEKPFDRWHAWDYLMAQAAHGPHAVHFQKQRFRLKRGQLVTTYRQLARDWGWDHKRTKRFLHDLSVPDLWTDHDHPDAPHVAPPNAPQVTYEEVKGCVVVTLWNYEAYQDAQTEDDLQRLLKKAKSPHPKPRPAPRPSPQARPTDAPPAPHLRPTREEGQEQQQGEEGQQDKRRARASTSTRVYETLETSTTGDAGGVVVAGTEGTGAPPTPEQAPPVTPAPAEDLLQQVDFSESEQLLRDLGVRPDVADRIARQKPVGYVLAVAQAARGKESPGGWAITMLDKDYPVPAANGIELHELRKRLEASRAAKDLRLEKLTGSIGLKGCGITRREGESEDDYMRRLIEERRREGAK